MSHSALLKTEFYYIKSILFAIKSVQFSRLIFSGNFWFLEVYFTNNKNDNQYE